MRIPRVAIYPLTLHDRACRPREVLMHRWLQPLLAVGLCAVTCRAEVLPRSPSLLLRSPSLLVNASRSITVSWEPVAEAPLGYELHLSVTRPGQPAFHVTKRAVAGAHSLFWGEMPDDAQCCFRVAAITGSSGEAQYSEETCFSSCACSAAGGAPDTPVPPSGCLEHTLGGAILGAALVLLGYAVLLQPKRTLGAWQQVRAWARSLAGGPYSHLTTQEDCVHLASSSATHGYELEARGAGRGGGGGGGGSGGGGSGGGGGGGQRRGLRQWQGRGQGKAKGQGKRPATVELN